MPITFFLLEIFRIWKCISVPIKILKKKKLHSITFLATNGNTQTKKKNIRKSFLALFRALPSRLGHNSEYVCSEKSCGIFGEKLVTKLFYTIWVCWIRIWWLPILHLIPSLLKSRKNIHNLGVLNPNMVVTNLAFDSFFVKIAKEHIYPNFKKMASSLTFRD